jgi:transcriptional regulator with XRE-family HTH domain
VTQETLAELADLNIRTLQKIEAGQTNILITTALRLQRALGCDWSTLMPTAQADADRVRSRTVRSIARASR